MQNSFVFVKKKRDICVTTNDLSGDALALWRLRNGEMKVQLN